MNPTRIRGLSVRDIRFPTSLECEGSDAKNEEPDYSCAYVIVFTDAHVRGYGLTFTLGRGTELAVEAVKGLSPVIVGKTLKEIFGNFSQTWRALTSESQLRWVGPEKGVIHLATAAIVNALFDLWARIHRKPLWKFLVDMTPEELTALIDFRYINDVLTRDEAIEMLLSMQVGKEYREEEMLNNGYPAYTTLPGGVTYSEEKMVRKLQDLMSAGWQHFKIKIGTEIERDKRICALVRSIIGENGLLMVDANQKWDVEEAFEWMKVLEPYHPFCVEEPTSPDDILGHATIKRALNPLGIKVATGEMCQNRVIFKQFLQSGAIDICQIDSTRLGGVPETLAVYLMAKKFNVPVCPHGGGVGLCQMIQHLQIWDYISVSGSRENRYIEYVDQLQQHFKFPIHLEKNSYLPPKASGFSTEMWFESLADHEYPTGQAWKDLFILGAFEDPRISRPPYMEQISCQNDVITDR